MTKILVFIMLLWFVFTLYEWYYLGDPTKAYAADTYLMMPLDSTDRMKACVASTDGFEDRGNIYINREAISYDSVRDNCFYSLGRGVDGTSTVDHPTRSDVRNEISGTLFITSDIDVVTAGSEESNDSAIKETGHFLSQIPKFLTFTYKFLDEPLLGVIDLSSFKILLSILAGSITFVLAAYSASKFGIFGKIGGALALGLAAVGLGPLG